MNKQAGQPETIAVVGAGIVGLAVAWSLMKRGLRVVVYDANPPGSGCSSGNAGAVSPGSVVPLAMPGLLAQVPGMLLDPRGALHVPFRYWPKALPWLTAFVANASPRRARIASDALAALYRPALVQHLKLLDDIGAPDLVRSTGQLQLFRDERRFASSAGDRNMRREQGVPFEVLDRGGIEELEPAVGPAYRIGLFLPNSGMCVNPQRYGETLAGALAQSGVAFRREAVVALLAEDRKVNGVRTASGEHRHAAVVVSAGAWSAELLRPLGYRVPLETQRGYHLDFAASGIELKRPIVPADRKVFITPMETGLRVAGTVEIAGLEAPPTPKRAEMLIGDLKAVLPTARLDRPAPFWMGHRPCMPDSVPVVGPSADRAGLHFAFGHGHLGLTGSAITGEVVAAVIAGEPAPIDLAPYRLERFA